MKRDPVVIIVVAMVVTVMIVFGFQMARRNAGQTASAGGASMTGQAAPGRHFGIAGWQDCALVRFPRQGHIAEFLGHVVPACKIEVALVCRVAESSTDRKGLQIVGVAMSGRQPQGDWRVRPRPGREAIPILVGKRRGWKRLRQAYSFLPATFYIGRDGKVVDKMFGLKGRGEIEDSIKKALAEGHAVQAQK